MKNLLLFIASLSGLASCAKTVNDPQPVMPTLSNAELLTAGPWQLITRTEVVTPESGGAASTKTYTVVPGAMNV